MISPIHFRPEKAVDPENNFARRLTLIWLLALLISGCQHSLPKADLDLYEPKALQKIAGFDPQGRATFEPTNLPTISLKARVDKFAIHETSQSIAATDDSVRLTLLSEFQKPNGSVCRTINLHFDQWASLNTRTFQTIGAYVVIVLTPEGELVRIEDWQHPLKRPLVK